MDAFTILLAPFWGLGILAQFLGAVLVFKRRFPSLRSYFTKKPSSAARVFPPISILKPLKGVEPGLRENLRSFFVLEYREFELLFCLETPMDPAFSVVREVAAEFPGVNYRFFFSGCAGKDRNPKVANMEGGYRSANYDWILITDSNVRMSEVLVADFTDEIGDPSLGIVSAVVRGEAGFPDAPSTFAGTLEAVFLNTFYARGMALAEMAGKECVVGKLMLFRKSAMERMGGLRTLDIYLAEDYMAGIGLKRLGYRIRIARVPVTQVIGRYRFEDFWKRHVRWGKIRKAQAPVAFLLDPVMQAIPLSLMGAFVLPSLLSGMGDLPFAALALFHLLLLAALDAGVQAAVGAKVGLREGWAWLVREALAPALWIAIFRGNEVEWRGRRLSVFGGGVLSRGDVHA